jgi:hypothetical protein
MHVRYAVKKKDHSEHAKCAKLVCVSPAVLQMMKFVSTAVKHNARFVVSFWQQEPATHAVNWLARTTESKSMNQHYVTAVGRVTNE